MPNTTNPSVGQAVAQMGVIFLGPVDYSNTTQDSLPVAGQAPLEGLSTRKVPVKGFKVVDYISFPFPKLCLAQSM